MALLLNTLPANFYMFQFLLLLFLMLVISFDHPTENFMLSCTKHIISIRFKINWNNFKSYLIGSSSIKYICNSIRFLSQQVKLSSLTKSSCITYHIKFTRNTTIIDQHHKSHVTIINQNRKSCIIIIYHSHKSHA